VTITVRGKRFGSTKIAADGTFSATVARSTSRYAATVAGKQSAPLQLSRRLTLEAVKPTASGARIVGHLVSHKAAERQLSISRQVGCTASRVVASIRTDRRGRFSVTVPKPTGANALAVYRVKTSTGGRTYTLPILVRR
jgi:hypothetical protein